MKIWLYWVLRDVLSTDLGSELCSPLFWITPTLVHKKLYHVCVFIGLMGSVWVTYFQLRRSVPSMLIGIQLGYSYLFYSTVLSFSRLVELYS